MTWSLCMFSGWWLLCLFSLQLLKDGSGTSKDRYVVHQNRSRNIVLCLTSCTWKWRKREKLIMVSWSYTALSIYDWFQLCFTGRYPNGPSSLDMFEHIYTVNSDLKPICILLPSWLGRWWVGTNYCTMRSKDHKDNMEGNPEEYWGLVDKDTKHEEELHI